MQSVHVLVLILSGLLMVLALLVVYETRLRKRSQARQREEDSTFKNGKNVDDQ